jgi:glycerol-3-phosphate dehydrogenase (NAD(P)+)
MTSHTPIAVLGAGSWGTALAIQFARGGREVRLWGRDRTALGAMARARRNDRYLPTAQFPPSVQVVAELPAALTAARDVLIVVPSHALRTLLRELAPLLAPDMQVAWATKGFEQGSGKLPHEVAREELGAARAVAVL